MNSLNKFELLIKTKITGQNENLCTDDLTEIAQREGAKRNYSVPLLTLNTSD